MNRPVVVECIDSATNEKLALPDIKRLKLFRLCRAFELLGQDWKEKAKYKEYPKPTRFVIFSVPGQYMREYMIEFENFPTISWFIARDVAANDSPRKLANMIGESIISNIRELKSTLSRLDEPYSGPEPWGDIG